MKHYDVLVAGLGTSGTMAALAAAKRGASVLALEANTYPGGLQTGGFVNEFFQQPPVGTALAYEKILPAAPEYIEAKKRILEEDLLKYGTEIRYEAVIEKVLRSGARITGVCFRQGDSLIEASANTVVDATADGALFALAGIPLEGGRPVDHLYQHSASLFFMKKPDKFAYSGFNMRVKQEYPEMFARESLKGDARFGEENLLGRERILVPSERPGIREGGHIRPRRVLSFEDILLKDAVFSDVIAVARATVDTNVADAVLESDLLASWLLLNGKSIYLTIPVPAGVLFPEGYSGIIAAGRHLGCDHDLGHALRMNSAMAAIGEVAGIIAAKAAAAEIPPEKVPYSAYSEELRLPETRCMKFPETEEEIREGLLSENPWLAAWSLYRKNDSALACKLLNGFPDLPPLILAAGLLKSEPAVEKLKQLICGDAPLPLKKAALFAAGRFFSGEQILFLTDINLPEAELERFWALLQTVLRGADSENRIRRHLAKLISDPGWRILEQKIIYQPETEDIAGTVKEYFADVIGESLNSDSQIR